MPAGGVPDSRLRGPGTLLWRDGDPPIGLYVHVPFCRALCSYCTFAKGLYETAAADRWLEALAVEVAVRETHTWSGRPLLATLFVGGGTPSALTPVQWRRLGDLLAEHFRILPGAEFTSEANPESFDSPIAEAMHAAGVNRVSLGSQSFDPAELALLGRIHDARAPGRAVATARAAGIDNVNLDLMYGLPGQDEESFGRSLDAVMALEPDHLSAYCLSLEPGTEISRGVETGRLPRPDEDRAASLYELLVSRARSGGYEHYEISNFARPGRESRHNLRYWTRSDVAALGPSAHALLGNHRWANPAPLETWTRAYAAPGAAPVPRPVPLAEARFEWIFLHLRLHRGILAGEYATRWGESFETRYGETTERLREAGLLRSEGGRIRLTERARFLSDAVFAEFAP